VTDEVSVETPLHSVGLRAGERMARNPESDPNVYLIGGALPSADEIAAMVKALIGMDTSPETLASIQARMDALTEAHRSAHLEQGLAASAGQVGRLPRPTLRRKRTKVVVTRIRNQRSRQATRRWTLSAPTCSFVCRWSFRYAARIRLQEIN
jgi:hypothetical protein